MGSATELQQLQVVLVERDEAVDGGVVVLRHVVHLVVAGARDHGAVDGTGRQAPEPFGRVVEARAVEVLGEDELQRLGHELIDQVVGVEAEQQRVAPGEPAVRRVRVAAPFRAVVGDRLEQVDVVHAGRGGVLERVGQPGLPGQHAGPGLPETGTGQGVESGRRAVRLEAAERRADVAGVDRADRPDAVVGAGGVHRATAAGADAEDADAVRIDAGTVPSASIAYEMSSPRRYGSSRSRGSPPLRPWWAGSKARAAMPRAGSRDA